MKHQGHFDQEKHLVDGGEAFEVWGRFVQRNICPIRTNYRQDRPLTIDADATSFQDFSVFHAETQFGKMQIEGMPALAQNACSDRILVGIPIIGDSTVEQFGNSGHVTPRDIYALSVADKFSLTKLEDSEVIYLLLPKSYAEMNLLDPHALCGRPISASDGMARLARDTIVSLWRATDSIQENQFAIAVRSACDLALLALSGDDAAHSTTHSVLQANLVKAQNCIRHNLCDPKLNPEFIAGACGFSVRYLHLVFASMDESVSELIRRLRLEQAYKMLLQASPGKITVTDACFSVGFSNRSHFSRLFRERFEQTPKDVLTRVQLFRPQRQGST